MTYDAEQNGWAVYRKAMESLGHVYDEKNDSWKVNTTNIETGISYELIFCEESE
jgi:hypothetical protein